MNKHEYKAGDKVRALVDFESLKKGEIYEVEEFLEGGCELWVDKEKTGYEYMFFYEIEPVTEPKYKAGDKVRALVDYESLKKGEIYEVEEFLEDGCELWVDKEKTGYEYMFFDEIEPVTDNINNYSHCTNNVSRRTYRELNINNMNEYKLGDKVKALVDWHSLKKGEIYEVREVLEGGCSLWTDKEKTDSLYMRFDEIEPVTIIETNNFQSLLNQQKTERDDLEKKHQEEWEDLRITK